MYGECTEPTVAQFSQSKLLQRFGNQRSRHMFPFASSARERSQYAQYVAPHLLRWQKAPAPAGEAGSTASARADRTHWTQPRPRAVAQQRPRGVPRDFSAPSVYARTPPTFERLALGGGNAIDMGFDGSMYRLGWVMCPLTSVRNAHAAFFH